LGASGKGAGPEPLPFNKLTAEHLAEAIHEATSNEAIRKRAHELGKLLEKEDGIGQTIALFTQYCQSKQM
jgi:UDP:flavonoid glycosyltransferase YjiC (YdhE family)